MPDRIVEPFVDGGTDPGAPSAKGRSASRSAETCIATSNAWRVASDFRWTTLGSLPKTRRKPIRFRGEDVYNSAARPTWLRGRAGEALPRVFLTSIYV